MSFSVTYCSLDRLRRAMVFTPDPRDRPEDIAGSKHRGTGAKPDPASTELAAYDFELLDKTVVLALDECLRYFDVERFAF